MSKMNSTIEKHTIFQSITLHLLPGVLITVFFIIVAPIVEKNGAPSYLAILYAILFVLIPFELGYLLYQGKKMNGTYSLKGIVLYREPMPVWQFAILSILLLLWVGLVWMLISSPIDNYLIEELFSWLPEWFFIYGFEEHLDLYSQSALLLTAILSIVLNGFLGPIVEELYFRGYLLPRISHLGNWAPLVNILLFSIYHFFTPWQNIGRILAFTPLYYGVWWKKNLYLGMVVHCAANLVGGIMLVATILR